MNSDMLPASVLLVGCGKLGGALLTGWRGRVPVFVLDPGVGDVSAERLQTPEEAAALPCPRLIVLAVKPALVPAVAASFRTLADSDTCFLSVAAGVKLGALQSALGPQARVVRSMPNIAVAKGAGVTSLVYADTARQEDRAHCRSLFELAGTVVELVSEEQIDIATAVSGSGPAFFFRFAEALAAAGEAAGLSRQTAEQLAAGTLHGAGALCDGQASLEELRERVTSPGGTTAAGLETMNSGGAIDSLAREAVAAAMARAEELSR